jgi:polysaccharide export outer membrane protein
MRKTAMQDADACRRGGIQVVAAFAALAALSGCASMPTSGPTRKQITRVVGSPDNSVKFTLVDIAPQTLPPTSDVRTMAQDQLGILASFNPLDRSDTIRPGDTLAIAVYEVGVTLFGGAAASPIGGLGDYPTANAQRMAVLVDEDGNITLPYIGTVKAAGKTPVALSNLIESRLRRLSQSPQVMIAITDTLESNAILSGAIAKPGRYRLTSARERLLDLVAIAGGANGSIADMELRVVRGSRTAAIRLADLRPEDLGNIVVAPGDRIELIRKPRTYTVFGATEKVSQVPFETSSVTLAEAIARASGPSDSRADARGVFLFRFEKAPAGGEPRPVVYRLNLLDPNNYFLAQQIAVQDKDVILFSAAPSNLTSKFINLLNQLSSPIVTGVVISR